MRVSHLAAMATLVALLGAMFIAMGSVSAQARNHSFGACSESMTSYLLIGDSCTIGSVVDTSVVTSTNESVVAEPTTTTATASGLGMTTVTVTDTDDASINRTYEIQVIAAPTLTVTFDDSDATVKAGKEVTVGIAVRAVADAIVADTDVTLKAPNTGVYFLGGNDSTSQVARLSGDILRSVTGGMATSNTKLQTAGAPDGEYVITATLGSDLGGLKKGNYTATLTVGDAGAGLSSATLSLAAGETANAEAGGTDKVNLVVEAMNSLGSAANAGDVNSILVYAFGGNIDIAGQGAKTNFSQYDEDDDGNTTDDDIGAKTTLTVSKATAGTVSVRVTVIGGAAGTAETDELVLTFAGSASAISVGDASDQLARKGDSVMLEVTATDKEGNTAKVNDAQITAVIKDADGKTPKNLTVSDAQKWVDSDGDKVRDPGEIVDTAVTIMVESDANNAAAAGDYTVEVMLNNDAQTKQVGMFTVVGVANSIEVSVDSAEVELGDVVTVTATITDADGNPIADDDAAKAGNVEFTSAGALELSGFGASGGVVTKHAKDGEATARFVVTKGSGTAVILVDHGSATGTATVMSAPVEAEAMPEEEASVSCLSELSGFATWSCGVEADASAIFDMVTGRGVSAIHLWNGSTWVRYSVVDDAMVPGSSDFMVTENDILYISN